MAVSVRLSMLFVLALAGAFASRGAFSGQAVATVTASGDPPLCWSITPRVSPVGSADGLPSIYPAPNCPGDPTRYLDGTDAYVVAPPAAVGFRQAYIGVQGFGNLAYGVPLELPFVVNQDIDLLLGYATRLLDGEAVQGLLQSGDLQFFFIDIPDGVSQLDGQLSANLIALITGQTIDGSGTLCGGFGGCTILQPTGGTYLFAIQSYSDSNQITMVATVTPPPTSTIDRLSTKGVLAGIETTITVYGFGFGEDSVVRLNQQELATVVFGPGELQATIPAPLIAVAQTTTLGIDVAEPAGLPSNRVFLDAIVRTTSDVNCDNFSNSLDALVVLRVLAELELPGECTADANADEVVDIADALWIRLEVAGLVEPYYPG